MSQRFLPFGAPSQVNSIDKTIKVDSKNIIQEFPQTKTVQLPIKKVPVLCLPKSQDEATRFLGTIARRLLLACLLVASLLCQWIANSTALLAQEETDLSATIWVDANRNGIFEPDTGEIGAADVQLVLLDDDGIALIDPATDLPRATATDSHGAYAFAAIPAGEYSIRIVPETFANGAPFEGYDSSNGTIMGGGIDSQPFTHPNPASEQSASIGLYKPLRLQGQLWHDADANGLIDGTESGAESGIEGATITLWSTLAATQTVIMTTTTTETGAYLFDDLLSGEYEVGIDATHFQLGQPLAGYRHSARPASDPQTSGLRSAPITLTNIDSSTINIGLYRPVQLGNFVWFDYDADGIQSSLEPGVPGVTIRLYRSDEANTNEPGTNLESDTEHKAIAETTSDAAGNYLFTDLLPGHYFVEFDLETMPAGYTVSAPHATNPLGNAVDSDADPAFGRTTVSVFLESGSGSLNFDMGIHTLVSVGDRVWYDNDGDGVQDLLDETGVPNVDLQLYYAKTNQPVLTQNDQTPYIATTNAAGKYLFADLQPGNYFVIVITATLPSGFQISPANVNDSTAAGDAVDSDFDPATARSSSSGFLLGNGSTTDRQEMDLDLGLFSRLNIGDKVWFDRDGDGVQNPSGPNGVLGDDDDEGGLPDIRVTLYDTDTLEPVMVDGVELSTRTNSQGGYIFANLDPGDYYLQFDLSSLPTGHQVTVRNAATPELDSDAHPTTGRTAATGPIDIGQHQLDMDMGVWSPVGIAGRVWLDDDGDGRRDLAEESLFAAAEVTSIQAYLHRVNNDQLIDETTLDSDGYYTFLNAPPGDYHVRFDGLPIGYKITQQRAKPLRASGNSDVDPATGRTPATGDLLSNEWITDVDMGIYRTAIVSGLAWNDMDRDGTRGIGETGALNINVTLYQQNLGNPEEDVLIGTQTTDSSGLYSFLNLAPGNYYVQFDLASLPSNTVAARPNVSAPTFDGVDSDANPSSGRTASTGLIRSGEQRGGLDLGIHTLNGVRIGDTIWHDLNANGTQDRYETGIAGVLLQLYATADPNTLLATTVSDADGVYLFDGLPATGDNASDSIGDSTAEYFVKIDPRSLSAAYLASLQNVGTDDAIDSDFDPATFSTTSTGVLAAHAQNITLDIGLYQTATLGDRVWLDTNANGVQDVGEEGIADVDAMLYDADGTPTGLATSTDAEGGYLFSNLTPGQYTIGYTLPDGYRFSPLNSSGQPGVDQTDSDVDTATQRTRPISLYSGQQNHSFDAGIRRPLALQNLIWLDSNNNGQRDVDEEGLAGVQLALTNAENEVIATTISNDSGQYEFIDLTPGTYIVNIAASNFAADQPLADLFSSSDVDDAAIDTIIDNGVDSATPSAGGIRSRAVTLLFDDASGDLVGESQSADFGFYAPLSIGNRIWHDVNNNGRFDNATESGIDGVTLHLYRDDDQDGEPDGEALMTNASRDGGYYLFNNLGAGKYIVEVAAQNFQADHALAAYANSWDAELSVEANHEDSADRGIDSAAWRSRGIRSATVELLPDRAPVDELDLGPLGSGISTDASSNLAVDFGFFNAYQIESRIWIDEDNSGGTDGGEIGLNDVLVELYADVDEDGLPDGTLLMTDTTYTHIDPVELESIDGYFRFDGLPAGAYVVQVPASNFGAEGPLVERLNSTEDPGGVDIPGLVIDDGVAVINPDEIGIRTQTIRLPRPLLSAAQVAAADENTTRAADMRTVDNSGTDADFGFFKSVEVGGQVWNDINANGQNEPERSESGVPSVLVVLRRVDGNVPVDLLGNPVAPQTTNESGFYRFVNLSPEDYYVEFDLGTLPALGSLNSAAYVVTLQDAAGVDDSRDSDVDPATGTSTATGFLASGEISGAMNMGIHAQNNVGGMVWFDNSINGLHEPFDGEQGVPNVVVALHSVSTGTAVLVAGQPLTETTDAKGYYAFEGVPPDNYYVAFDLGTLPPVYRVTLQNAFPDTASDSDADPLTGRTKETGPLSVGEVSMELDMGIFPLVAVGDRVWFDDNQDGQQTPGELGVPGIRVTLYSESTNAPVPNPADPTQPWAQSTNADGRYLFSGIEANNAYYVQFDLASLPLGYFATTPAIGGNATNSDADPLTGQSGPTAVLQEGDTDLTLDMGIVAPSGIGDRVWYDLDADGIYEPNDGELGVSGVDVTLFKIENGNSESAAAVPDPADESRDWTVTTDESGLYLFTNLPSGDYFVHFDLNTLPTGHQPTWPKRGSDQEADSDADRLTGQTQSSGPIYSGAQKLTLDMGIIGPASVGSTVWFDLNRNGVRDVGEAGVADVAVQITRADGSQALDVSGIPVASTVTNKSGLYRFDTLMPGAYSIVFDLDTLPDGYVVSKPNAGGNELNDSDANPSSGWTRATQFLHSGDTDEALDMGIHEPFGVRVGDGVWHDLNANGLRELGEPGILGVSMELYVVDAAGTSVGTGQRAVTDADGNYLFDELPAGEYAIAFDLNTLPGGYQLSGNRPDGEAGSPSNVDIFSGQTESSGPLTEHEQYLALDLGIYRPVSLGDLAWLDRDADGTYDVGEFGVSGVAVTLLYADGTPTGRSEVTNSDGRYLFENLVPGDYILEFLPPSGFIATSIHQGLDTAVDSDIDPASRRTAVITIRSDTENSGWDAGFFTGAALGNFVWLDEDANGMQDPNEKGIAGVTVRLYSPLGIPIRETYTDLNGFYGFSGLGEEDFFVEFIAKEELVFTQPNRVPNDHTATEDNKGGPSDLVDSNAMDSNAMDSNAMDSDAVDSDAVDSDAVINGSTLVARTNSRMTQTGINYSDWDAGMTQQATIGNYVWFDFNRNGLKDVEEEGVDGVKVELYNADGQTVANTISNGGGFYQFDRLTPSRYRISVTPPPSFQFTQRSAADDPTVQGENLDSDVDPETGETGFIELLPGQNDTTRGVGLVASPGAITLSSMDVTLRKAKSGDELIVRWATSAELDTFGYHIRQGTNGILENAVQVTPVIIPSQGTTGGLYEFRVPYNAETDMPVGLLNFWLVEVEIEDKVNVHGPVGVTARAAAIGESKQVLFLPLVAR